GIDPRFAAFSYPAIIALVWLAVFLNYRGIHLVGTTSTLITLLVAVSFGALTILGVAQWRHNPLVPFTNPEAPLATAFLDAVLVAMWLYGGFEKVTVASEELEDPARALPMALAIAVPLCAVSYIAPTLAALAAAGDWKSWGEAHFLDAA